MNEIACKPRSGLVAALAAVFALLAGCAMPSAPSPQTQNRSAIQAPGQATSGGSTEAEIAEYQALVKKFHSPDLVAKLLFKQAREKHNSKRAILAALLALRAGDFKTANQAAALLRKLAPDESDTWSVSMRIALAQADLEMGRKAAAKAYALGGAKAVALGTGGAVDPWFVYPLVQSLATAHPKDGALQLVLARSALDAGDASAAIRAAQATENFGPGARAAKLIAIQSRWDLGQQARAMAEAARALAKHPHDIGLRVFYANILSRSDKPRRAREVLADARALAPDDPEVAFGYAIMAANEGKVAEANARLAAMLEAGDDSSGVYSLLGQLAASGNDWGQAFGWYEQIQSPDDLASSRVPSLVALDHWKGSATAEDYLQQLSTHFPGLAPTWAGVHATLLGEHGKSEAAWQLLGKTLERYPQVRPLRYQRAMLGEQLGKTSDALAALKRLVEEEPGNPMYLNGYGYTLLVHTTRYRVAYGYIKRALAISPDDGAILDSMGWALYRLGKPGKALGYLARAWRKTDDIAVARHLIAVYVALNRRGEAQKVLNSALGQSPRDPKLLKLKRQLARR